MVDKCRAALSAAGIGSAAFTETEGKSQHRDCGKSGGCLSKQRSGFHRGIWRRLSAGCGESGRHPGCPWRKDHGIRGRRESTRARRSHDRHPHHGGDRFGGDFLSPSSPITAAITSCQCPAIICCHAYAILDPELIASVPAGTAAACGVDAMVHALEAYLSLAASPFSDMFALKALQLIGKNLRAYAANRGNEAAAEAMMMGSLFAGIAFSHARLGDVHAMSHPVSAYFNVAHGVANAILLPAVVEYNELADQGKYYDIYRCVAKAPVPEAMFSSHMLTEELRALNMELGIPSCLKEAGVKAEYFDAMAEDAMKSGNISVNPRSTTKADVLELYKKAF